MAYGNNPYVDMMSNLNKITNARGQGQFGEGDKVDPNKTGEHDRYSKTKPYDEGQYRYDTSAGMKTASVEDMMSRGTEDGGYTGELGKQYLDEFISRLTNMDSGQKTEFKSYLGGGISSSEWADIVGLDPVQRGKYSEWFGGLPSFSNLMGNIANIEEYDKARKKQARASVRARAMQPQAGRQSGFSGGRSMLSGALKGTLLRDALKTQMFSINEDVGRRYGQLTASVSDALSKAYSNLRALRTQMPEDGDEGAGGTYTDSGTQGASTQDTLEQSKLYL